MRLHSKRYSMRAAARLLFRRENRLYRRTDKGMDESPCPCYYCLLRFYQPKLENGEEKPPKLP